MSRTLHRLKPLEVKGAKRTGMYADGGGLYLQVKAKDSGVINRSWVFRYSIPETRGNGRQKERQMGLGSVDTISLAEARDKALNCRKLRDQRIDPIEARRVERANAALEAGRLMAFDQCRDAFIAAKQAGCVT